MMREQSAIPEVLGMPQFARLHPQIVFNLLPGPFVQAPRPARPFALPQTAQAFRLEAPHPSFYGSGMLAQPLGHLVTTDPLGREQNPVEAVVVARLLGACDLILQG
jgi:hypothetical protein